MIDGVQTVAFLVRDLKRAADFYSGVLGLPIEGQNDRLAWFRCGPVFLALVRDDGSPAPAIPRDQHGPHDGAVVTLRTTDISTERERLKKAGVKVYGEYGDHWGHGLTFEDPDGNVLKLLDPIRSPVPGNPSRARTSPRIPPD